MVLTGGTLGPGSSQSPSAPQTLTPVGTATEDREVRPEGTQLTRATLPRTVPPLPHGWQRLDIPEVGTIDIPPVMEMQGEAFRKFKDALAESQSIPSAPDLTIVLQQKGLNAGDPSALKQYVRIMIATIPMGRGEVGRLTDEMPLSDAEIDELKRLFEEQVRSAPVITVLEVYRPEVVNIAGMQALCLSYTRRVQDNPPVIVRVYRFHNYDRIHSLTVSYRVRERDMWEKYVPPILESFRITHIRGPNGR